MTTYSDLVQEILGNLQGFSTETDQVTSLSADMSAADLTFRVVDGTDISRGAIEIGDELIWVQSTDPITGLATVLPQGRGWRGSSPAAHVAGDTVVIGPMFPRAAIKREVTNQIKALYPQIFAVKSVQFTYSDPLKASYELPADAEAILDVRYQDYIGNWQRVRGWENERQLVDSTSGNALRLGTYVQLGQPVQVVYACRPTPLTNDTDDFSVTGLSESAKDLVVLGTMCRLIPMLDVGRLTVQAVPAQELDQPRPLGSALTVAKELRAQYDLRVQQERKILNDRYPARVHWTR